MLKLIGKEINTILGVQTILIWTYASLPFSSMVFQTSRVQRPISKNLHQTKIPQPYDWYNNNNNINRTASKSITALKQRVAVVSVFYKVVVPLFLVLCMFLLPQPFPSWIFMLGYTHYA